MPINCGRHAAVGPARRELRRRNCDRADRCDRAAALNAQLREQIFSDHSPAVPLVLLGGGFVVTSREW
jgi:hypothetical protein